MVFLFCSSSSGGENDEFSTRLPLGSGAAPRTWCDAFSSTRARKHFCLPRISGRSVIFTVQGQRIVASVLWLEGVLP